MTGLQPWARFDDLVAGTAVRFGPPRRILRADRVEDVVGVLAEVQRATRAGDWAFGYVAYEAAGGLDGSLVTAEPGADDPPPAWFALCAAPATVPPVAPGPAGPGGPPEWVPDWSDAQHAKAVAAVREHIAAGATYQCNLTDRLRAAGVTDPERLYATLALAQRGAYNAYLDLGRHVIASASPELFFEWSGDRLRTRPMKGTAARGPSTGEDRARAAALRASAKERAENLMIVDLLRNDLSRVARTGSVAVPALFTLERYPTVWQLTSEVTARPRADVGLVDLFRALFPCGSVTGAPKPRTMRLIRDLETGPRGVYCGAIGYVAPPGAPVRARFSVAIRTAVIDRATGAAVYGAGGAITWDSAPAAERAELLAKAAVLTAPAADHDLLETLGYSPGHGLRHLDRHLARLADSAAYFGYPCDPEQVRAAANQAVAGRGTPARVRIRLARSGRVHVDVTDAPPAADRPVTLAIDDQPVDSGSVWLRHKTSRREPYTTRAARHPDADDVVLVNERGEITETTIANLAVRLHGRWCTPPTSSGCLPGIERGRLLDRDVLAERVLTVADLRAADDIALVNSLRGWRPAVLIDQATAGANSAEQSLRSWTVEQRP